jgi:Tfp pilus assembly PilM family ATPase/Tfp pilus assembly protein PilN
MTAWIGRFVRSAAGVPGGLVVGVDVGVRRIKLAGIGGADADAELRWAVDVPTPGGIFGPDGQFDSVACGRVLAQLLARAPASGGLPGAVLLPSAALRVRRLQTAASDPAALMRLLAEDSELRVPGVPVEALYHSVCTLGDTPVGVRGDAGRALVAAAARRDAIRAYAAAAAAGGIRPLRVSAPAAALANVHAALHPDETAGAVLLLHVGSARAELVVVHGGAPLLALPVVQGTDQLLERLRACTVDDAQDPEDVLHAPGEAAAAVLDEWVGRLRGSHRTAVGAAERHLRRSLDELPVRLSGGIARYPAVVERLAAAVPAPVAVLDPAACFGLPPEEEAFGPALVLALGAALEARAALRPADGATPGAVPVALDLAVPEERTSGAAWRETGAALVRDVAVWAAALAALVVAVAVPALLEARLRGEEAALGRAREAYAREARQVSADSARVSALQSDSLRLAGTLGTLAALEADRYGWPRLMHAAASALPSFCWLEGLELEPGAPGEPLRFRVSGVAPEQADVSRYERALGGFSQARQVGLESSESLQAGPFALVGFRLAGAYGEVEAGGDQPRPGGAGYHGAPPPAAASLTVP